MKVYDEQEVEGKYKLTGSVTKVSSGRYDLAFFIRDTGASQKAGYTKTCTYGELQSMSAIKDASESLIKQMA